MDEQDSRDDGGMQWFEEVGRRQQMQETQTERKRVIMAGFEIHRATKRRAKLRLGMSGPAGSGKTYSALLIAGGLGGRIGMIDTEHGSGDLYADLLPEGYDVLQLTPPYTPARYVEAIHALEDAGVQTIIVDSLTHAWTGEGGSLDRQGKIADKSGNSWQAWRQVTPEHNALVEALLQSKCHIIATMRAKTEYVQEKDERTGRQTVRKIGLAPIMRDGIEYEFTTFLELDLHHMAFAGKDRTRLFDGSIFKPDVETGRKLLSWLDAGVDAPVKRTVSEEQKAEMRQAISGAVTLDDLFKAFSAAYRVATALSDNETLADLTALKNERKAWLEAQNEEQLGIAA
ncbi:ATP-binding protein [Noviherbaspirillum sp. L7-7A]|uniref:ATP-binding protein n=1 Tax=Noviherbaspirillum sp. L7-7A TaxID=2850560 RepID=UPI001C2C129D|nr:ATP-binding protein [Noviherbaspirillum sp. L7-7A]MBV0882190.1 ATP-binding protein [Noviherbaspirillum sp. L7-7A]